MKTIYSILYVTINAALNEKVSIGLVMSNNQEHFFKFSPEKLFAFKNILDPERYNLIKRYMLSIEQDFLKDKRPINNLFNKNNLEFNWVSESYISYLAKYSNNVVQFSRPRTIDIDFNSINFRKIFEKYIFKFEELEPPKKEVNIHSKIKENLFPKIENRVNLEISLTSVNFKNLFAPIEVDILGMNCIPLAGQTIDFEKKHYNLENDVTRFISLTKAIELDGHEKGKYYILGREPQNNIDKNHLLWEHIRDSNYLEFIDIDEYGIVEEYIKDNNVKPFFQE